MDSERLRRLEARVADQPHDPEAWLELARGVERVQAPPEVLDLYDLLPDAVRALRQRSDAAELFEMIEPYLRQLLNQHTTLRGIDGGRSGPSPA